MGRTQQYSGTGSVADTGIVSTTKINSSAMVVAPGGLTLLWFYSIRLIDGLLHYMPLGFYLSFFLPDFEELLI